MPPRFVCAQLAPAQSKHTVAARYRCMNKDLLLEIICEDAAERKDFLPAEASYALQNRLLPPARAGSRSALMRCFTMQNSALSADQYLRKSDDDGTAVDGEIAKASRGLP